MDTDILFHDEGRFSVFNVLGNPENNDSADSSDCNENFVSGDVWSYEVNSDLEFMLVNDQFDFNTINSSSTAEDFENLLNDWQNISTPEEKSSLNEIKQECVPLPNIKQELNDEEMLDDFFEEVDTKNLDLCSFVNGDCQEEIKKPTIRAGVKKIDLKAQKYIVDEDEDENVDIETVSDNEEKAVLEAGDLKSLLEQFEATCKNDVDIKTEQKSEQIEKSYKVDIKIKEEPAIIKEEKISHEQIDVKPTPVDISKIKIEPSDENPKPQAAAQNIEKAVKSSDSSESPKYLKENSFNTVKHKQIIDGLPQELINRIKESGKRKGISLIDPVPTIKKKKNQEILPPIKAVNSSIPETIRLDHDYCTTSTPYPKNPKKDSGFESAEEEDKALRNQPVVKNADGKLMVSLLKVNTIRNANAIINEDQKKKKLNFEEYKKRREGLSTLKNDTRKKTGEPNTNDSNVSAIEDPQIKWLKHEEKLKKMAMDLLSTPPKSVGAKLPPVNTPVIVPQVKPITPTSKDMIVKTLVSIGVNTDLVNIKDGHALNPVEKLEEIKPLLKNAGVNISSNSLIASMIEHLPKIVKPTKNDNIDIKDTSITDKNGEHGEDKTIIYLPKDRVKPKTCDASSQTKITLVEENKRRYRRRKDSSSDSSSSEEVRKPRNRKRSPRYSRAYSQSSRASSSSSSSSSYRSTSRTNSTSPPRRKRKSKHLDEEYIREVEERRVVYVGKISTSTTKEDLRRRFSKFGPIKSISLHFRSHGDNYGFVTFTNKLDAYAAIEHANDDPYEIKFDLSFGGRRLFCKTNYSDLDNMRDDFEFNTMLTPIPPAASKNSFDDLLKEMQEKLCKRKL